MSASPICFILPHEGEICTLQILTQMKLGLQIGVFV